MPENDLQRLWWVLGRTGRNRVRWALAWVALVALVGMGPPEPVNHPASGAVVAGRSSPPPTVTVVAAGADPGAGTAPFSSTISVTVTHDGTFGQAVYVMDCDNGTAETTSPLSAGETISGTQRKYTFAGSPCHLTAAGTYDVAVEVYSAGGSLLGADTVTVQALEPSIPAITSASFSASTCITPCSAITFSGSELGGTPTLTWKADTNNNCGAAVADCADACYETTLGTGAILTNVAFPDMSTVGVRSVPICILDSAASPLSDNDLLSLTVTAQTIAIETLVADPPSGSDPLNNVELEVTLDLTQTNCAYDSGSGWDAYIACNVTDAAACTAGSFADADCDVSDRCCALLNNTTDSVTTADDVDFDCDYTPDGQYFPVAYARGCGTSTGVSWFGSVVVDAADTFILTSAANPLTGEIPLTVNGVTFTATGTATGAITALAIDCGDDGYDAEDEIGDPGDDNSFTALDVDNSWTGCLFSTVATHSVPYRATRDGVLFEGEFQITATAATTPASDIVVAPATLSFSAFEGSNPASQTFTVSNATGANGSTGNYSTVETPSVSWASISDCCGAATTETDTITVNINTTGIMGGSTVSTVYKVCNDDNAADCHNVTVQLEVQNPTTAGEGFACTTSQASPYCRCSGPTHLTSTSANGNAITIDLGDPDGAGPLNDEYVCGQYANGDPWVVGKSSPQVVRIEAATPAPANINCNGTDNGYQLDVPVRTGNLPSTGNRLSTTVGLGSAVAFALPSSISVTDGPHSFIKARGRVNGGDCTPNGDSMWLAHSMVVTLENAIPDTVGSTPGTADEWRPTLVGAGPTKIRAAPIDAAFNTRAAAFVNPSIPASSLTHDAGYTPAMALRVADCPTTGVQPFAGSGVQPHQSWWTCYDSLNNFTYGVQKYSAFIGSLYRLLVSDCAGNATCQLAFKKWVNHGIDAAAAVAVGDWGDSPNYQCGSGTPTTCVGQAKGGGGWYGIGEQKLLAYLGAYLSGNNVLRSGVAGCVGTSSDVGASGCTRTRNFFSVDSASYLGANGKYLWGFESSSTSTDILNCDQARTGNANWCSSVFQNDCMCRMYRSYTSNHVDALRFNQEFVSRVGGAVGERIWNHPASMVNGYAWDRPVGQSYCGRIRLTNCWTAPTTYHGHIPNNGQGACPNPFYDGVTDGCHPGGYSIDQHNSSTPIATEIITNHRTAPVVNPCP
jgi:hypothetical protein